ncbi:MAG: alpha/beta fold hydrolase [Solirubrobacteraceae bacterium]
MPATIDVQRTGLGPPLVLVHGGVGRAHTWTRQAPLAQSHTLLLPARRGYPPNEPVERQDFELDATDLEAILDAEGGAHLAGFSYGGLGAALLAARRPDLVHSLTLIEVPLYSAAPDDPEVAELARLGETFAGDPGAMGDADLDRFRKLAGIEPMRAGDRLPALQGELALARNHRSPREADPDYAAIRGAGIPALVCSGVHENALERLADAQAELLGGERALLPGAGHAVPRAAGFNQRLAEFLAGAAAGRA